ncbi:2Fe-2S iron-sulfur cluster-binding protein [Ancylomarina longa]|uniref:Nitric oxide dioxygenase n=1 Tax=Ancylomarina longa TaxID=2487017 RepID=A0A434AYG4_9BACT|nr:2Fe-2S iron-sulfur cluster-binding protein [Ancylomarina longa]RUT79613.1 nitric oxide dioxygenase [Ancylomarina longa]
MEQEFYHLRIVGIEKPIKEATTLSFKIPENLKSIFEFQAGQHLCFRFYLNGVEERRMYSLHNSPHESDLYQVTVKTHPDGFISRFVANSLKIGDKLEVSNPLGDFTINPVKNAHKNYYLFAAGSGITPIFSMIKSILMVEPNSYVYLLYGNRTLADILFYDELAILQEQYPEQLIITHTLSTRFLDFSLAPWEGKRGRIDDGMVEAFITDNPLRTQDVEYYICGPEGMIQTVQDTLIDMGVPTKIIHFEYFSAPSLQYDEGLAFVENASVSATIRNKNYQVRLEADETILEGLQRIGAPAPYSCKSGICGSCKAKLLEGEVKMKASIALSSEDKKKAFILTCQSLAQTPNIKIDYQ